MEPKHRMDIPLMPFWLQMTIAGSALTYAIYMLGHTSGIW